MSKKPEVPVHNPDPEVRKIETTHVAGEYILPLKPPKKPEGKEK